jgi:hypothetical protein
VTPPRDPVQVTILARIGLNVFELGSVDTTEDGHNQQVADLLTSLAAEIANEGVTRDPTHDEAPHVAHTVRFPEGVTIHRALLADGTQFTIRDDAGNILHRWIHITDVRDTDAHTRQILVDTLALAGVMVTQEQVGAWTREQYNEAAAWAQAAHMDAVTTRYVDVPPRPGFLPVNVDHARGIEVSYARADSSWGQAPEARFTVKRGPTMITVTLADPPRDGDYAGFAHLLDFLSSMLKWPPTPPQLDPHRQGE